MDTTEEQKTHKNNGRLFFGLFLIIIGAGLIIQNTGILPPNIRNIVGSWQMFCIIFGIVFTVNGIVYAKNKDKYRGMILIVIGTFFILPKIFDIPIEMQNMFWPIILIIIGVLMITARDRHRELGGEQTPESYIDLLTFMGGGKRKITANNFLGGRITNIFGGTKIDLTAANMQNTSCMLDLFIIFGGSEIIVPRNWDVQIDVTSIFGGFSDKRNFINDKNIEPTKMLVIKGFTIFGGGEVKSY